MNITKLKITPSTHLQMEEFKAATLAKMDERNGWSWNSYSHAMKSYLMARQAGNDEAYSFKTAQCESTQSMIIGK